MLTAEFRKRDDFRVCASLKLLGCFDLVFHNPSMAARHHHPQKSRLALVADCLYLLLKRQLQASKSFFDQ
jgi:hypothetical protein